MAYLNIEKLTLSCKDREKEEQKRAFRRKTILVLIQHYLKEFGYIHAADTLQSEVNFNLKEYSICDNIHLASIIQDYESYYFLKYQKLPQIMKKTPEDATNKINLIKPKTSRSQKILKLPNCKRNNATEDMESIDNIRIKSSHETVVSPYNISGDSNEYVFEPLLSFKTNNTDWRAMAELILQDTQSTNNKRILWKDVIGHDRAKELLKEAIVYPVKYRELFSTSVLPWRSMLLYGPSGTGKTLLASAAASESGATFFKICISTLVSKWRGESEKLIKVLFDLAKHYAPSIVFIDELDALLSHRGEDHEASRRMKTELFMQLDSLFSTDKLVLVLSATNMPWQLDYAILRRLEKRVLIACPDTASRIDLFRNFLPKSLKVVENFNVEMDLDYEKLAEVTLNYSAFDIETVCKEAKMSYMRQIIEALEYKSSADKSVLNAAIQPLNTSDILEKISKIKPSASELCMKYVEWQQKHGSE